MHNAVSEQLVPKHDAGDGLPRESLGSILIIDDEELEAVELESTHIEIDAVRLFHSDRQTVLPPALSYCPE